MARILAIDWDQNQLHVVAAKTASGGVDVESVHTWKLEQPATPAAGEAAGHRLRNLLKEAGIAPAPVVICLGRDRVIIKEIHFPTVPSDDEPALVRFQAAKDLNEAPEKVVIDYAKIGQPSASGENQALAVVVRRSIVETFQAMCRAAGLRLEMLAPRPFGVAKALKYTADPLPNSTDPSAVLTIGSRWADFCVVKDGDLYFTRSLAVGPTMAGEIRRNFALYRNHAEIDEDRDVPKSLYFGDDGRHAELASELESALKLRVHKLQPVSSVQLASSESIANQGALTAALGLLNAYARKDAPPINFVRPKEPKPPPKTSWLLIGLGAAAAILVLIGLVVLRNSMVGAERKKLQNFVTLNKDLEKKLKNNEQTAKDIEGLADWDEGSIPWLAEFAALTERFPKIKGLHLLNVVARPARTDDEEYEATITLTGIVPAGDESLVTDLMAEINSQSHSRAVRRRFMTNSDSSKKFVFDIDVARRPEGASQDVAMSAVSKQNKRQLP